MKVLTDTQLFETGLFETGLFLNTQSLQIIPRSYPALVDISLRNESTNIVQSFTNAAAATVGGYLIVTTSFDLDDEISYELDITESATGDLIYRDRILSTAQTIADYTINNNEYTTRTHNNDYVQR